jgi:uncharacterized protein DUF4105
MRPYARRPVNDSRPKPIVRVLTLAARALGTLVALLGTAWAVLALSLDGPGRTAAAGFVLLLVVLRFRLRPHRRARLAVAAALALVVVWWLSLQPSNDRDWQPDVARLPGMRVEGDRLELTDVRDFAWTSDEEGTPRWQPEEFQLADVVGVDLVLCDWGAPAIVHTIMSWEFADGRHLAISIETRKELGEGYSAVRGAFRQFELAYIVATERDVLGLRAAFRGERLRLYRLAVPPEEARELLLTYAKRIQALADDPAWYNAVTHNCTTTIRLHALDMGVQKPWDWRMLVNGRVDEMLYERGRLGQALSFAELRARCDVTEVARAALDSPDFSARIRATLPPRAAPGG